MTTTFDWLVVGAGLSGATMAERIASELGQRVLVIDRRHHVGGNTYDAPDAAGVRVHHYGAHIFHTKSESVWRYLNRYTEWLPYVHRVQGSVDGRLVPLPVNLDTITALYGETEGAEVGRRLIDDIGAGEVVPVLALLDHRDPVLRQLGERVYEKVFLHYTVKQWGLRPEEIDRSVTGRVPVVASRDDRYFRDAHQGIPTDGYLAMVERMLDHPNISVELGCDRLSAERRFKWDRMVYTGPVDELFGHIDGRLPYRSLRFEHETLQMDRYQPVSVVNHPNEHAYTRIIEHAHFAGQHLGRTTITREYPQAYEEGCNEPFYPLPHPESHRLYERYAERARTLGDRVILVGRLAEYRYYDMDQAVAHALATFRSSVLRDRNRPLAPSVNA